VGKYPENLLKLAHWFGRQKRVLPWRDEPSPYRVWISEIMLQQTQVITVVPYFERFIERFPSVHHLAAASLDEVLLAWAGLGYYSRARNLHAAAGRIVLAGEFPSTLEGWLELPGIGPYTAGAITSIALDQPRAILDGNVERVLSRIRRISRTQEALFKGRLWRLSQASVDQALELGIRPSDFNQALMELGALICQPRKPACGRCPVVAICRAHQFGDVESFPPRKPKKPWIKVFEEVHCTFNQQNQVLVVRQPLGGWRAGLWDLPVERSLGARGEALGRVQTQHVVTRHKITRVAQVWRVKGLAAAENAGVSQTERWIDPFDPEVAVGSAFRKTIAQVKSQDLI
jgi:A/G-specific adenine glycosylase